MNFYNKKLFKLDHSGNSLAIYPKKILIGTNIKLIYGLKKLSKDNNNCNLRICFHKSKKDKLQNMMILLNSKSRQKSKIHKHKFKDEVYQIIEGKLKILVFLNKVKTKKIILQKGKNLIARIDKNKHHTTLPMTDIVIYHEIRQGPFSGNDSIFREMKK